jgi:hypothetical protein
MWQQAKMHLLYPNLSETRIRFILSIYKKYKLQERHIYSFSEEFFLLANETMIEVLLKKKKSSSELPIS